MSADESTAVKVALRIRPQGPRELEEGAKVCALVPTPAEPQVAIGDKAFTFDHVFDRGAAQDEIYSSSVSSLVAGTFEGYNATVLAYGQTGSGKTYTMGTGFDLRLREEEVGMVPRAVTQLFDTIAAQTAASPAFPPQFRVAVQFIELYNEEVKDLLQPDAFRPGAIRIHEDKDGTIFLKGASSQAVSSVQETMSVLKNGALGRTTAATGMNATSSRSHAIFTLEMTQQRLARSMDGSADSALSSSSSSDPPSTEAAALPELETLTAKLHFVDLAGSERQKRTGASGERLKEGIAINSGLQFLGNVISALADEGKKTAHVPYRDSKLTRLLQDSLGGNSRTLMMACVSPSDTDFVETLSTLNYANRAKQIKNRVVVNQDRASQQLAALRQQVERLETELAEFKQGKRLLSSDGTESLNDMYHENVLLQTEVKNLNVRVKALTKTVEEMRTKNASLLCQAELRRIQCGDEVIPTARIGEAAAADPEASPVEMAIQGYMQEIEDLKWRLVESQSTSEMLRAQLNRAKVGGPALLSSPLPQAAGDAGSPSLKAVAREDILMLKARQSKLRRKARAKRNLEEDFGRPAAGPTSDYASERTDDDSLPRTAREEELGQEAGDSSSDEEDTSTLGGGEWDGEELEEEDEAAASSEEVEEEAETARFRQDLADLTQEISIKERLVEELEASEQRLAAMKDLYERKIAELTGAVAETERERDATLAKIDKRKSQAESAAEAAAIRRDFEGRISGLKAKLAQTQGIEREHSRLLRQQQADREKLARLHADLADMKRAKAALLDRMKDESKRQREADKKRAKELAALEREARKKDAAIRQLKSKSAQQDSILKRKNEELERAKKKAADQRAAATRSAAAARSGPSASAARGARGPTIRQATTPTGRGGFSARRAKAKWVGLEAAMSRMIRERQAATTMEAELERELGQRLKAREELAAAEERLTTAADGQQRADAEAQRDAEADRLRYVETRINEIQAAILHVEDTEDGSGEDKRVEALMSSVGSVEEARYLLGHLFATSVSHGLAAVIKDRELRETSQYAASLKSRNELSEQLLEYTIAANPEFFDLRSPTTPTGAAASLFLSPPPLPPRSLADSVDKMDAKARRRSATPAELLYPMEKSGVRPLASVPEHEPTGTRTRDTSPTRLLEMMDASADPTAPAPPPKDPALSALVLQQRLERLDWERREVGDGSSGARDNEGFFETTEEAPRRTPRMGLSSSAAALRPPATEPLPRKVSTPALSASVVAELMSASYTSTGGRDREPWRSAGKPSAFARNGPTRATLASTRSSSHLSSSSSLASRDMESQLSLNSQGDEAARSRKGVFARLQESSAAVLSNRRRQKLRNRGIVMESSSSGDDTANGERLLYRLGTVEGHEKAVLAVAASDRLLLTGSKDQTAKLWDLESQKQLLTLGPHQFNVTSVALLPRLNLILSVSTGWTSVWDLRSGECVRSLSSSGLVSSGPWGDKAARGRRPGPAANEANVFSLHCPGDGSDRLYAAGGNAVRIWDLRRLESVGELAKATMSPSSDVFSLASFAPGGDSPFHWVVTGSRDRYIKLYRVRRDVDVGVVDPVATLEPPHYENVTALLTIPKVAAAAPDPFCPRFNIFSGSRDKNVMLWEAAGARVERRGLVAPAHRDAVLCLSRLPAPFDRLVASSGRDGVVRVWSGEAGELLGLGAQAAHKAPVNALAANDAALFTASDDCRVGIWRAVDGGSNEVSC